jgi:hypothetical protein
MKIRYKITTSINFDPHTLIDNAINELVRSDYIITNRTKNHLEFKNNIWKLGSRNEAFGKIDRGSFDFNAEKNTIVFFFYLNTLFEIVAAAIFIFLGITQDSYLFIFIIFIVIMIVIRIITVRGVANRMMENILDNDL